MGRDPRADRQHHGQETRTQEGQQDQEAVQPDQGRRCLPVRHQASSPRQGGEEAEVRCPEGAEIGDSRHAPEEASQARSGEKNRLAAAEYAKILAQRQKEAKEARELKWKRSASLRESKRSVSSQ